MKKLRISLLTVLVFFMSLSAIAQNCDPWIVSIYKQLYNRQPSSEECSIKNYNNGSWSSYQQLTGYVKNFQNSKSLQKSPATVSAKVSGDPWITQVYKSKYNRMPNSWEFNIRNYNNGSWGSYDDLSNYITEFQNSLRNGNILIETAIIDQNKNLVVFKKNGISIGVNLLSNKDGQILAAGSANVVAAGGGNVVAAGGGNVVAAGGGNVVAAGGGNVIAAGGGNVVAAGGANFQIGAGIAGVNFAGPRSVMSVGALKVKTSGTGALIFK